MNFIVYGLDFSVKFLKTHMVSFEGFPMSAFNHLQHDFNTDGLWKPHWDTAPDCYFGMFAPDLDSAEIVAVGFAVELKEHDMWSICNLESALNKGKTRRLLGDLDLIHNDAVLGFYVVNSIKS